MGGMALRGMSTTVVTPPEAAALVPVLKPSHSVLPGSFKWTWASTRPGSRSLGLWSTYVVDGGKVDRGRIDDTTEMILPVTGDTQMVAGETTSDSSGRVSTALVDTRTTRGPALAGATDSADMVGYPG